MSAFEIGKKYTYGDINNNPATCIAITEGTYPSAVLAFGDGSVATENSVALSGWKKVPEKKTKEICVILWGYVGDINPDNLYVTTSYASVEEFEEVNKSLGKVILKGHKYYTFEYEVE